MLSIYCPKCAQPNYYSLQKPQFCGHCGSSLSISTVAKVKASVEVIEAEPVIPSKKRNLQEENVRKLKRRRALEEDVEEGEGSETIPDIDKLEYEIVGTLPKLTLGELAKQRKTGFTHRAVEKISQADAMKQFQKEAQGRAERIEIQDDED